MQLLRREDWDQHGDPKGLYHCFTRGGKYLGIVSIWRSNMKNERIYLCSLDPNGNIDDFWSAKQGRFVIGPIEPPDLKDYQK